jgi:hypothetical protein
VTTDCIQLLATKNTYVFKGWRAMLDEDENYVYAIAL